jgi:nicotinic acid mononucleotide adenylyltransferase
LAFFGGTFNPISYGGILAIAQMAQEAFKLDKVIFYSVRISPPHKKYRVACFGQRSV